MSKSFNYLSTALAGLYLIEHNEISDNRGFFERVFCAEEFKEINKSSQPVVQINHTLTKKKGTIRGMHFQYSPHAETKIVTCIQGEIFDVAVDIRKNSPTFLQWHAEILNGNNRRSLYIPDGFAHGFQTLTDNCQLLYFHSEPYTPKSEGAINVNDPKIAIQWPYKIVEISEKDKNHPMIDEKFIGVNVI
jgi:dTDP-4-dehydrorhamnose 3,5-epimerase